MMLFPESLLATVAREDAPFVVIIHVNLQAGGQEKTPRTMVAVQLLFPLRTGQLKGEGVEGDGRRGFHVRWRFFRLRRCREGGTGGGGEGRGGRKRRGGGGGERDSEFAGRIFNQFLLSNQFINSRRIRLAQTDES